MRREPSSALGPSDLRFCGFGRLRSDRMREVHVYFDSMSIMVQVGLLPEPATT